MLCIYIYIYIHIRTPRYLCKAYPRALSGVEHTRRSKRATPSSMDALDKSARADSTGSAVRHASEIAPCQYYMHHACYTSRRADGGTF